jgi:hypothetical protein
VSARCRGFDEPGALAEQEVPERRRRPRGDGLPIREALIPVGAALASLCVIAEVAVLENACAQRDGESMLACLLCPAATRLMVSTRM